MQNVANNAENTRKNFVILSLTHMLMLLITSQCLLKMFPAWPGHKLKIICAPDQSVDPVSHSFFSSLSNSFPVFLTELGHQYRRQSRGWGTGPPSGADINIDVPPKFLVAMCICAYDIVT